MKQNKRKLAGWKPALQICTLRVEVCNLNLRVYVFPGVVTVQLGIVCSNYTVQIANLNPPV